MTIKRERECGIMEAKKNFSVSFIAQNCDFCSNVRCNSGIVILANQLLDIGAWDFPSISLSIPLSLSRPKKNEVYSLHGQSWKEKCGNFRAINNNIWSNLSLQHIHCDCTLYCTQVHRSFFPCSKQNILIWDEIVSIWSKKSSNNIRLHSVRCV